MALFLTLTLIAALWLKRRMTSRRYGRIPVRLQALAALRELERRDTADAREVAYRLNEILRAALADSRATGRCWPYVHAPGIVDNANEWECFWRELDMRYRSPVSSHQARQQGDGRRAGWIAAARTWIERLPEDEASRASGPETRP